MESGEIAGIGNRESGSASGLEAASRKGLKLGPHACHLTLSAPLVLLPLFASRTPTHFSSFSQRSDRERRPLPVSRSQEVTCASKLRMSL